MLCRLHRWRAGSVHGDVNAAGLKEARACRLVVKPDWQGAGIGVRFLDTVCDAWRRGDNPHGRPMSTLINTAHPGLAAALRRHSHWTQVSAALCGSNKARSAEKISRSAGKIKAGYGGHFRSVQGFRYVEGIG